MSITYTIGENQKIKSFDEIASLISDGDSIQFEKGIFIIQEKDLSITNITLMGENDSDTVINFVPNITKGEKASLFILAPNGELQIKNLTIRVAPNSTVVTAGANSSIITTNANLVWNHYNIKQLHDNIPLVERFDNTVVLTNFMLKNSIVASINVIAEHLTMIDSIIGDSNGSTGYIAGWASEMKNCSFNTMRIGIAGAIETPSILGASIVENVPDVLLTKTPNMISAPLILKDLEFNQKPAIENPTKDQKNAINLKKKYHNKFKFKRNPEEYLQFHYYLVNEKTNGLLYIQFKDYDIPDDQPLIYNKGNMVVSGEEHDSSNYLNVQASGQLILTKYTTEMPWIFEDDGKEKSKVKIYNSDFGKVPKKNKKYELVETDEKPTIKGHLPDLNATANYYLSIKDNPVLDVLINYSHLLNNNSFPTIFISGSNETSKDIHLQLKKIMPELIKDGFAESDVIQITPHTLSNVDPEVRKDVLIKRTNNIWYISSISGLYEGYGPRWLRLFKAMENYGEGLTTHFIFFDTDQEVVRTIFQSSQDTFKDALYLDCDTQRLIDREGNSIRPKTNPFLDEDE